ncbi:MAG TPA: ATP-binding protein [Geobacteraceae bacterium]
MAFPTRSISGRLVIWLFLCTSVVLITTGIFLYGEIGRIVITSVDRTLHSKLQIITGLLHEEHGRAELELSDVIAGEYVIPRSGHYYKVMDGNRVLAASPSLASEDFDFALPPATLAANRLGERCYNTTGPDGEPVRALRFEYAAFGKAFTITLAESLLDSYEIIAQFRRFLQITIPLSIIFLCLIAWWVVRSSLQPIKEFSTTIETITHKNLTERIDAESLVNELTILAGSFNALLDRLHHLFEGQRRLLADASHQLKTPLSVIRTECDVALQRERSTGEYTEALRTIHSYSGNMARLINNLLSLARIDAGLISAEAAPVSLRDCVDEAVRMTMQQAEERGVRITHGIDGALCVTGSRIGLAEAFQNLIENGVRYNRQGGTVTVNTAKEGAKAVVTVTDTGLGIKDTDQARIFERFFRAEEVRRIDGTGLGLSIVKSVVSAHGGEISVQSEPGKGSRFVVRLPLADTP